MKMMLLNWKSLILSLSDGGQFEDHGKYCDNCKREIKEI